MKKIISFMILGSFTVLSAQQYQSNYQSYNPPSAYQPGGMNSGTNGMNNGMNSNSTNNSYMNDTQRTDMPRNDMQRNNALRDNHNINDGFGKIAEQTSEADVSKHIYENLSGYISSGNQNVSFEINDGVVTITGNVHSKEEKDKIESDLKRVEGVKEVINNIQVSDPSKVAYYQLQTADNGTAVKSAPKTPKDYAALDNDKKINAKIREKLNVRGFEEVSIITANGVVTLGGVVNSSDEFVPLVMEIEKVEGVKKVNNKVTPKK